VGSGGFGTRFRLRDQKTGQLDGDYLPVDFAANARSLGADAVSVATLTDFKAALRQARQADRTTVIVVQADRDVRVPGYGSWWDVAIAEVSTLESVRQARAEYNEMKKKERHYL
jgi:3D-(3,5/4)-trihydroxycyclohexane-1,2-dione acylhydrolase (decyclizing)